MKTRKKNYCHVSVVILKKVNKERGSLAIGHREHTEMATYICSLSKKETSDPVVAPNGYVYDKKCIESRKLFLLHYCYNDHRLQSMMRTTLLLQLTYHHSNGILNDEVRSKLVTIAVM
jgi:hypothetical protein